MRHSRRKLIRRDKKNYTKEGGGEDRNAQYIPLYYRSGKKALASNQLHQTAKSKSQVQNDEKVDFLTDNNS